MTMSISFELRTAGVALLILWLGLATPWALAETPVPEAVREACESLTLANFKKYNGDKTYVRKIQRGLEKTFGDSVGPQGQDGIIGVNTTAALKKFCLHSMRRPLPTEGLADLVVATVLQYSAIADKFPNDWTSIASVAVTNAGEVEEVFRVGETAPIAAPSTLLPAPAPSPTDDDSVSEPWISEGFAVSYQLVERDLQELQDLGEQNLLVELEETLSEKTFPDKQAFSNEVKKIVTTYPPPTEAQVEETAIYRLTTQSFNKPMVRMMPDAILNNLQKLKDIEYDSPKELAEAVNKVVTEVANKEVSIIVQSAEESEAQGGLAAPPPEMTFRLTEKSFVTLLGSDIPVLVLNALEVHKDKQFDSEDALVQAVKAAVTSITNRYQAEIMGAVEVARSYALSEDYLQQLNAKLQAQRIPDQVLSMLEQNLQGVEYPNRMLFEQAVLATLYQRWEEAVVDSAEAKSPLQLTDTSSEKLKAEKAPEVILQGLRSLQNQTFADEQALEEALEEAGFDQTVHQYTSDSLPVIVDRARKYHPFSEDTSLSWQGRSNGEACGCILDDLAGTVYGFYPFWLADDEKPLLGEQQTDEEDAAEATEAEDTAQFIDFSLISRLGFYAVSFNNQGEIRETGIMSVQQGNAVKIAHRYLSKLDLVVFKQDWAGWFKTLGNGWSDVTDRLVTEIVDTMEQPLTDFLSQAVPYVSFGQASVPTLADGVTINFDVSQQDGEDYTAKFVTFVRRLKHRMMETSPEKPLNVMLMMPLQEAVRVIKTIEHATGKIEIPVDDADGKLADILVDRRVRGKVAIKAVNHYLVFLAEPTTRSKKELRLFIEAVFKGDERRRVLRRIIPVITPTEHDNQQLEDDLIYFKDNFAGVGFWPLPLKNRYADKKANAVTDSIASQVNQALSISFLHNAEFYQEASSESPLAGVCTFVCPNRWVFRIVGNFFLMIFLLAILAYGFICRVQAVFWTYFPGFVIVVILGVLWWFLIMYCDPSYEWLRTGNLPLMVVIVGLIGFSIMQYLHKQKEWELP